MGGTARQFNKLYREYKKRFKKPIYKIATLMPKEFSDDLFVSTFVELFPHLWEDLNKQYDYWHKKNEYLIKKGKRVGIILENHIISFWIARIIAEKSLEAKRIEHCFQKMRHRA